MEFNEKTLLVSGGTFGHIYSALVLQKKFGCKLMINSSSKHFIDGNNDIEFFDFNYNYGLFDLIKQTWFFWKLLLKYDQLIIFGSYVCIPVVISSVFSNIKKYFQEQNTVLGKLNRLAYFLQFQPLLSWEKTIYIYEEPNFILYTSKMLSCNLYNFFKTKKWIHYFDFFKEAIVFGYIINKDISTIKEENMILIMPGGGGSTFFDNSLLNLLSKNIDKKYQIIFIAKNKDNIINSINIPENYEIHNFIHNIDEYIQKSKLIISRSGAGNIAKILKYNKKAILIPWDKAANGHQLLNAQMSQISYLEQKNLHLLMDQINILLLNNESCNYDNTMMKLKML